MIHLLFISRPTNSVVQGTTIIIKNQIKIRSVKQSSLTLRG